MAAVSSYIYTYTGGRNDVPGKHHTLYRYYMELDSDSKSLIGLQDHEKKHIHYGYVSHRNKETFIEKKEDMIESYQYNMDRMVRNYRRRGWTDLIKYKGAKKCEFRHGIHYYHGNDEAFNYYTNAKNKCSVCLVNERKIKRCLKIIYMENY